MKGVVLQDISIIPWKLLNLLVQAQPKLTLW